MDILPLDELVDQMDQIIASLDQDENRFYVVLDLAHQLRDELSQVIASDSD
jgi:hypothetical protein